MIRLLVYDRENKIENNIIHFGENDERRITKIASELKTGNFNIEFLGVDKNGNEIYRGKKDSWKNIIIYLFDLYKKYFEIVDDDDRLTFLKKNCVENTENTEATKVEEDKMEYNENENKVANNKISNTVTMVTQTYDSMKAKAEAFDKLIDIVCHDGVKFHQEWNKQDIRKACKGGSVKVGEVIGEWHGEIKFTGNDGQKDFSEFVRAMVDGLDVKQRLKFGVSENE